VEEIYEPFSHRFHCPRSEPAPDSAGGSSPNANPATPGILAA